MVHLLDNETCEEGNYAVIIKNPGTPDERAFWARSKIKSLKKAVDQAFTTIAYNLKPAIRKDLKQNFNLIKLITYNVNEDNKYVIAGGYCEVQPGQVGYKQFFILVDSTTGEYTIYEVVGGV